jgi:hypothetical protein
MKSGTFVATAALVSAAALQLTGCAKGTAQIVPANAAELISQQVQSKSGFTPTAVNCPSGIEAKVGAQFACTFAGPSGNYAIRMKVTNVNGGDVDYDMSWRLIEPVDNGSSVTPSTDVEPTETPDDSDAPGTTPPSTDGDTPAETGTPGTADDGDNGDSPSATVAPPTGPADGN